MKICFSFTVKVRKSTLSPERNKKNSKSFHSSIKFDSFSLNCHTFGCDIIRTEFSSYFFQTYKIRILKNFIIIFDQIIVFEYIIFAQLRLHMIKSNVNP